MEICSRKFRWNEKIYDTIFKLCVALTNEHIKLHPLRKEEDLEAYYFYRNSMAQEAEQKTRKRRETQELYRQCRRARLEQNYYAREDPEEDVEENSQPSQVFS